MPYLTGIEPCMFAIRPTKLFAALDVVRNMRRLRPEGVVCQYQSRGDISPLPSRDTGDRDWHRSPPSLVPSFSSHSLQLLEFASTTSPIQTSPRTANLLERIATNSNLVSPRQTIYNRLLMGGLRSYITPTCPDSDFASRDLRQENEGK